MFKDAYNIRPFEYLTFLRLQKAKELLIKYPDMTISNISTSVGYNSPSYFLLIFKKSENMTPGDFRAINLYGSTTL